MEEKPKKLERFTKWMLWIWTAPMILITIDWRVERYHEWKGALNADQLRSKILLIPILMLEGVAIIIAAIAALIFFIVSRRRGLKPVRAAQGLIVFGATLLACLLIDWPGITGLIFDGKLPFFLN